VTAERGADRETSADVLRAARALLETARAPRGVVTWRDRVDYAQTAIVSAAMTSTDPAMAGRLLAEVAELGARLAHVVEDRAGRTGVEDALAGRPVRWKYGLPS
jgi:hypothetical protein